MLNRMKVGTRLFAMSALLAVLTAMLAVVGGWALSQEADRFKESEKEAAQSFEMLDAARSAQVEFKKQVQEWKDLLLRGSDPADYAKYLKSFRAQKEKVRAEIEHARSAMQAQGVDTGRIDRTIEALESLNADYDDALKGFDPASFESVRATDRRVRGKDRPPTAAIDEIVEAIEKFTAARRVKIAGESEAQVTFVQRLLAGAYLFWLLAAALLSALIIGSVTSPVSEASRVAREIADGNLGTRVAVSTTGEDELRDMLRSVERMSDTLRQTIGEARSGAGSLVGTADEIVAAARLSVQAAQQQATAVQETTSSTAELTETVRVTERRAGEVQQAMDRTVETGQGLRSELGEAQNVLAVAREELRTIVDSIQGLVARNQQIGEIIENVREVADQTQLLAVNAGIEAAKAGELGRGFSVVATEMKTLAEQSKKAAQRIRGIVGEVQQGTADVVRTVEAGRDRVQDALAPVGAMMPKVEQLTVQVDESGQSLKQILAIVQQQTVGIDQINQAMKVVHNAVQSNLAQNQQLDRSAENLRAQARQLNDSVAAYRL